MHEVRLQTSRALHVTNQATGPAMVAGKCVVPRYMVAYGTRLLYSSALKRQAHDWFFLERYY
jgi:hypothetical protein